MGLGAVCSFGVRLRTSWFRVSKRKRAVNELHPRAVARKQVSLMKQTELNAFRKVLESRQAELGNSGNRDALAIDTSADELDRIQHAADRDMAIGNLERHSSRLLEVRAALRRMDSGTFGICGGCEENINPKRLAAIPWASLCIVCQEAADRERQAPGNEIEMPLVMAA
jgi:DnaK suppressor protein